ARWRTLPSYRPLLFGAAALPAFLMTAIYPYRVAVARLKDMARAHDHYSHGAPANRVIDPVCGMTLAPHLAEHRAQHRGRTFYFCSAGCARKFAADPARYLDKQAPTAAPVPERTIATSPVPPATRQLGPR